MSKRRDPYVVLGVRRGATEDEIKAAYHRLALQWHPDRNPGRPEAAEKFREIHTAWEILSKPANRRAYDAGTLRWEDIQPVAEGLMMSISEFQESIGWQNRTLSAIKGGVRLFQGIDDMMRRRKTHGQT